MRGVEYMGKKLSFFRSRRTLIALFFILALIYIFTEQSASSQAPAELAAKINSDVNLEYVQKKAREVVKTGFNAGDGYEEVWIRDYNTFIELAMDVFDSRMIEEKLLPFFKLQGEDGSIPDGFIPRSKAKGGSYEYIFSDLAPEYAGHKNTVETDQETSLVQAVYKYVTKSGNTAFLDMKTGDKSVARRLELSMEFLMTHRRNSEYGLLWGATTVDWGDVQHCHPWGVFLTPDTKRSLDIYDNAMFIIALDNIMELLPNTCAKWSAIREDTAKNVMRHLWDNKRQKFIPHVYPEGSPFSPAFDESNIYYHGGTAVAIEAGLLSREQIKASLQKMIQNMHDAGAASIGITVYPPYPDGSFENPCMKPYQYQNGGDWTWFGGRMIQQLIRFGFIEEAYEQAAPMIRRVADNRGFYEWYSVKNEPMGAGTFKGSAGVLYKAAQMFDAWAAAGSAKGDALVLKSLLSAGRTPKYRLGDRVTSSLDERSLVLWLTNFSASHAGSLRTQGKIDGYTGQPHCTYVPDRTVEFDSKGTNAIYTTHGWSGQEETHRWTEGPKAGLSFVISDDMSGKDMLLRLKAHAYLGGGRTYQTVGVFANGQQVTAWKMKDLNWYEAVIPIKLLKDGVLNLEFTISDPTSPSDVGESRDTRKLGIAVRKLVIEAQK